MFCRKQEKKKSSAKFILIVGALAAIGALSITRKGKDIISMAKDKMTRCFKKDSCTSCGTDMSPQ